MFLIYMDVFEFVTLSITKPITGICFTRNHQIIIGTEDGYLWRWDWIEAKLIEEWDSVNK